MIKEQLKKEEEEIYFIPIVDLSVSEVPTFRIAPPDHTDCKQMSISRAFQILEAEADQIRRDRIENDHLRKRLEVACHPWKVVYSDVPLH